MYFWDLCKAEKANCLYMAHRSCKVAAFIVDRIGAPYLYEAWSLKNKFIGIFIPMYQVWSHKS